MIVHSCFHIALALLALLAVPARGEEGGAGHWVPGTVGSFIDTVPGDPGLALVSFSTYYDASAGRERRLPLGGLLALDVGATVYAETVGALYETPFDLLGAEYAAFVGVPYMWMEIEATVRTPGLLLPSERRVRETADGFGDLMIYPVMLGWTALGGDLKYDLRLGVYAPTGEYEVGRLANVGRNYWTLEPGALVSWVSSTIGTEVSGYLGADFNTENSDTDYESGTSIHFEGTAGQHLPLGPGFAGVGATGFVFSQVGADGGDGAGLGDFKGSVKGVGPVLSYATKLGGNDLVAELKWIHELGAEKRLQGDVVWLKLAFVFGDPPPAAPAPLAAPPAPPLANVVVTDEEIVALEPLSAPVLEDVARVMRERPEIALRVEDHDRMNDADSEHRARATVASLEARGVAGERLTAVGYGATLPLAPDQAAEPGRARNRRTEFHLVP